MNKNLYTLGIFFLWLTVACGLLQSFLAFELGPGIYRLDSIVIWVIGVSIISTIGSVCLLKYFHYRKYWFVFYAAIVALITHVCHIAILSSILLSRQGANYYRAMAIVYLCATILYAISLIFSGGRKTIWLKIAGIYGLFIALILLSTIIWGASIQPGLSEKITLWVSLFSNLVPVLFIMQLKTEIELLKTENVDIPMKESVATTLSEVKIAAGIITALLLMLITYQWHSQAYWGKRNFESTKALARLFEARTYVNSKGDTLRYRLLKPLNYDSKKRYPLVVSLPYGGQPGTDTIRQIEGAAAAEILSTESNRIKYPAFIFVPNCPAGSGWGGIPNYPSVDTLVYKAINALDTAFSIDAKRRYVTGISRGGYGSWHFICTRPDMFAAAIPVCGGDDPKLSSRIVNVSVWAFHGAKDQNVPVSGSRGMIEGMRKAGQNPKYTEYPNEGHNIWYQVSITPGLWDWLFAQKRD
ncbi:hypothetical protein [Pedobacter ginsengisoli]|uniref:carboxylesterase family protein n=1 Tax=Pedobacter ginsengisoli TaxID=363852 RepID=UPI00254C6BFF|nr:hypothetical protein [Pedobacter ginsengisoli]